MDFGKEKREADYVESVETGFSIPWTKSNLQKIVSEIGMPRDGKISYTAIASNGIKIHVDSFEDLLNATSIDELLHFGRIPTDFERKRSLEELGGKAAD